MARRYEFYVLVARTISHLFASLTREILFLLLEHKIHTFSPPCNILYVFNPGHDIFDPGHDTLDPGHTYWNGRRVFEICDPEHDLI